MKTKDYEPITPDILIGAVVEEVITDGECIECVKLRIKDGRQVEVDTNYDCDEMGYVNVETWMEVM